MSIEAEELWTEGNTDVLGEYYTDDFVPHGPDSGDYDLDAYEAYVDRYHTAFPDAEVEVHETMLDGDKTAATFTYRGTREGEFVAMEPNGSSFAVDGISMARIEDGKFAEIWRNVDSVEMLAQIGAIDLPASRGDRSARVARSGDAHSRRRSYSRIRPVTSGVTGCRPPGRCGNPPVADANGGADR
ncbi:ester cyclase [Salinigranum sp.]|uniref:ester cyclase n=1 Tax=Salinigranum sp. TaxID=1966351 RepID=UPI003568C39C